MMPGIVSLVGDELGAERSKVDMLTTSLPSGVPFSVLVVVSGKTLPARWMLVRYAEDGRLNVLYRGKGDGNPS